MSFHFSWGGATPYQINSLGSIQACHLIWGNTSLSSSPSMQHLLAHSFMADRSMVVGKIPMDHMYSFMCTSHINMTVHTPAFLQVQEHSGNLLYADVPYIWMPTCMLRYPHMFGCPCMFGHPHMFGCPLYVWILHMFRCPPYVWMPPYIWMTPCMFECPPPIFICWTLSVVTHI